MRVGLLWRREWDPVVEGQPIRETCRLRGVFAAFSTLGVEAVPVVYSDSETEAVRAQLLELDGVLVWVNPIEQGLDRSTLDALLREVSGAGVWVSAHPDVISRMGTKEVLVDTASMSWGIDTRVYRTSAELRRHLPRRLAEVKAPIVLKQRRGMGGLGVWKVERLDADSVLAQHASGAAAPESMAIGDFLDRCEPYFTGRGLMVEQPYLSRLPEGMIRAYLTHNRVVGFTHQYPRGLMPPGEDGRPATKEFESESTPAYADLRQLLEATWVPEMQTMLDLPTDLLPVIWDADFLHGPKDDFGNDTYVLCEINASSTFAFPEFAMPSVARAAIDQIRQQRHSQAGR